jgi:hypothetical protein
VVQEIAHLSMREVLQAQEHVLWGAYVLLPMVLVFIFGGVRSKGHHYYDEWLFYKFDKKLLKEHDAICWWWAV